MSEAEATIKSSILMGITDDCPATPEKQVDNIFKRIFEPQVVWAVVVYLAEQKGRK